MNFTFGTKNLSRVQKALQQLERLTPLQIEKIAGEESLAELRLKRLQNHKQKFNNNGTICQQGQSGSGQEYERKQDGQAVRWNIFKQMPVLAYKESERKYQKQFMNKIDEYRKNIFKNQEDKWGQNQKLPNQSIPNPQPSDSKKNPIFSAVLANQTHSSGLKIQKQTPQANKPVLNKPETNNIFTQSTQGPTNPPVFGSNVGTWPKAQQLKQQPKPKNIGFVPNLTTGSTSSDLFTKKFQVPEIMPPQKIDSKSSLFPESNPLSQVKVTVPYNIFTSKPSDLFTKNNQSANVPKIDIYQKKFIVEQPQPPRPLQVGKGNLFSKSNPISEIDSSKVSTNMFTNNNNGNIFNKRKEQSKPDPPSIQQQKSFFSHPPTSTPNIFANSSSVFSKSADNQPNTGGLTSNFSGSVFQTKIGSNPLSNPLSNPAPNIFENKKFGAVQQKNTNVFKNTSFTPNSPAKAPIFSTQNNPTNDKPNPFSFINNKKIEEPTVLRQETEQKIVKYQPPAEQKGSFFNLKPVQVAPTLPKKEPQTPKQQVKAPPKKVDQIFKQFANKTSSANMFSNQSANTNTAGLFGKPPESAGSIFGGLGKTGGIFSDTSANNSDNIFTKKDQVPMFGAKEDEQQQEDEGEGDDVIQYKEETDPTKSTGNYKYEQSEVIYRETIPKFKRATNPIIENVIISIQKFTGNKNFTLSVRLSNKCMNYSGTIVPGVTEASKIKQSEYKNISVKKIMSMGPDNKPNLQLLKIQFRDEKQGHAFFDKIAIAIKK